MTRLHRGQTGWWDTCEAIGEHRGDTTTPYQDDDGNTVHMWTCCDEVEVLEPAE